MASMRHVVPVALVGLAVLVAPACRRAESPASPGAPAQARFATPEAAAAALQQAFRDGTPEKAQALFGREWVEAAASGDAVADRHDREVIAMAMDQGWRWEPRGGDGEARELIIGEEEWPFPVPLIKVGSEWQFDSAAGLEEVLDRRIGANELDVIALCRDYVRAQKAYAAAAHDGKPAGRFAQRFRSTPGQRDGLFWRVTRAERASPFGQLVEAAVAEGYDPEKPEASPFRGYRFRILTAQGASAPGGKKNYVVSGAMTGGFALLASPAKYGASGVMTFKVGPDGVVYQKDLGDGTDAAAAAIVEFNPDESWAKVQAP